jgi:hypothetical protein
MIDYAYATSHQPGARYASLYFLSSQLFTPKAAERLYARLTDLPVLAIADRDPYVTFEQLPDFSAARAHWHFETLAPHMGLPHWERPEATAESLERGRGARLMGNTGALMLVRRAGLEPARSAPLEPKSSASTSSATCARAPFYTDSLCFGRFPTGPAFGMAQTQEAPAGAPLGWLR